MTGGRMNRSFQLFLTVLSLPACLWAHEAHEHGVARLQIAVDGKQINFIFESPGDSIYGFEHEAKSPAEKKAQKEAIDYLKEKFADVVEIDSALKCQLTNKKVAIEKEEGEDHSEVHGEWIAKCEKSPTQSALQINFSKRFKKLSLLKVDLISDQKQSHQDLKKAQGKVQL